MKRYFTLVICCFYCICLCRPSYLKAEIKQLTPIIVRKIPHDSHAFTQGLAIEGDQLYESTGLYGRSTLRHLDIGTGKVLQQHNLLPEIFAEGIAVFKNHIIQISWKEQCAFVYDKTSFKLQKMLFYSGEGWGLCRDQETIWMSNGSEKLIQRDGQTFKPLKTLSILWENHPLLFLNDLECDGKYLYANVFQKDWIVRLDKQTGEITAIIHATNLLSEQEKLQLQPGEVLNGIAFRAEKGTFLITGKKWPWIFEVQLLEE